jgi:general secretion pathway protein D
MTVASVNYLDVGLTLNVEPAIYLDDTVGIKVSLDVSSLLNSVTERLWLGHRRG